MLPVNANAYSILILLHNTIPYTVKPVYNDHPKGYFSAFSGSHMAVWDDCSKAYNREWLHVIPIKFQGILFLQLRMHLICGDVGIKNQTTTPWTLSRHLIPNTNHTEKSQQTNRQINNLRKSHLGNMPSVMAELWRYSLYLLLIDTSHTEHIWELMSSFPDFFGFLWALLCSIYNLMILYFIH